MSRASNTLTTSDVLTTPIKLKYSASYDSSSYTSAGIRVLKGVNDAITITGSVAQTTLNYISVRHLFYSNYLTSSYLQTSSSFFNWEQSTAASGTLDADLRIFPTGSGDKIKILSIPRNVFGEKLSRRGFELVSQDGYSYKIIDDGNGNLVDVSSADNYVNTGYFIPRESFTVGYVTGPSKNAHVGNILYSLGLIIITNPDYYNVLDVGPIIFNQVYTYYDTDVPKNFNPLSNAQPDSSPIDTASLTLYTLAGQQFPSYTIYTGSVTLTPSDPLYTTLGTYNINYYATASIGTPSNTASITVNIIPNCNFTVAVDDYYYYANPVLVFDFTDQLVYANSGSVIRDLSGRGNDGIYTQGGGTGSIAPIQGYNTTNPGYLSLPGAASPTDQLAIKLVNGFKFPGNIPYSFAAWIRPRSLGYTGVQPGIIAAEGYVGGNPIGWSWNIDGPSGGVTAARYDGTGATDSITATWNDLYGSPTAPYNQWLFLFMSYDGGKITVGNVTNSGVYSIDSPSTFAIAANVDWDPFVGLRRNNWMQADYGYVVGYDTALTNAEFNIIYTAMKAKYGY